MKLVFAVSLFAVLIAPYGTRADYDRPTFEELARESTAIVAATVVEFSQDGHAKLEIHRHLLMARFIRRR